MKAVPVIDVRTPAEFDSGCIFGAQNLFLFSNEERATIGTIYKHEGKEKAILKGLELIGPRMAEMVQAAEKMAPGKEALLYCWRGGMRSGSLAWLLDLYGFKIETLKGGYKSYRRWIIDSFSLTYPLIVLGGKTGSGKTLVLQELKNQGQQVLDLEALANHKGSAFGAIGELPQPGQEYFENLLGKALREFDLQRVIWVEDESRMIGRRFIPDPFWEQMRNRPVIFLEIELEERVKTLVDIYGKYPKEPLAQSIRNIEKRLGGLATKQALDALDEGDLATTARLTLHYYDKTYEHGLSKRDQEKVFLFKPLHSDPADIARELIIFVNQLLSSENVILSENIPNNRQ